MAEIGEEQPEGKVGSGSAQQENSDSRGGPEDTLSHLCRRAPVPRGSHGSVGGRERSARKAASETRTPRKRSEPRTAARDSI